VERAKLLRSSETGKANGVASINRPCRDPNKDDCLWDGSELGKRIEFAKDGLDSHLAFDEIFSLRKEGMSADIEISEVKECIMKMHIDPRDNPVSQYWQ
jgi:hypothetical protein